MNSLKRQREIQAAATAGPWGPCAGSGGCRMTGIKTYENNPVIICDVEPDYTLNQRDSVYLRHGDMGRRGNLNFICESRTDWPELTDWAERAWQLLDLMSDRLMNLAPTPNADLLDDVEKLLAELPE